MESISQLINSNIQRKAFHLAKLTKLVKASLPVHCQDHVDVADIRNNQLVLITDSPAWASRLRLYSQNMLQMLEEHANLKLASVYIKQSQPRIKAKEPPIKYHHLSHKTAELIDQTADSISDSDLQQALKNLAKKRNN